MSIAQALVIVVVVIIIAYFAYSKYNTSVAPVVAPTVAPVIAPPPVASATAPSVVAPVSVAPTTVAPVSSAYVAPASSPSYDEATGGDIATTSPSTSPTTQAITVPANSTYANVVIAAATTSAPYVAPTIQLPSTAPAPVVPAAVAATNTVSMGSTAVPQTPTVMPGCDSTVINAKCPTGQVMTVTGGFYGRRNTTACPGQGTSTSPNCQANNIVSSLGGLLNGQNAVTFNALPGNYPGGIPGVVDPCPNVYKEFELDYTCA